MGYLNNQTITVDAILTKKGRELLSKGRELFQITKFALADDEVDYTLWNEAHPSGSNYYGYAIEQLPLLEPIPDETQMMRYKLVTLPRSTPRMPYVTVTPTSVTFQVGEVASITPNTINAGNINLNSRLGYTAILHNSDAAYLLIESNVDDPNQFIRRQDLVGLPEFLSDTEAKKSVFAIGLKFKLIAKQLSSQYINGLRTKVTIIGNETGGATTVDVFVRALSVTMTSPSDPLA